MVRKIPPVAASSCVGAVGFWDRVRVRFRVRVRVRVRFRVRF